MFMQSNPQYPFSAADWYWYVGGDTVNVYGSKRNIYVDTTDADFQAWMTMTGIDAGPIGTEAEIWPYVQPMLPAWMFNGTTFSQPSEGAYTKDQLAGYNSDTRARKETGGIVVNAVEMRSDLRASQNIVIARYSADAVPPGTVFKTALERSDGKPYPADAAAVIEVSNALFAHVNRCLTTWDDTQTQIDGGTVTTLEQIDTAYAW
jgi:hypothetical protein